MSPKRPDLQARKDRILAIVVSQYIDTVQPVSSASICKNYNLDLSSATIRNILAELEMDGYLTHPHTSAGRMPTQLGYRYFVDFLMNEIQLLENEKHRLLEEYKQNVNELDRMLQRTTETLSEITQYTTIITLQGKDRIITSGTSHVVNYPETQDIEKIRGILHTLEEKERLIELINRDLRNRIEIYIGHEIACREIEDSCSLAVSSFTNGRGNSGRIAILGPTRMDYARVVSTLGYVSEMFSEY